MAFRVLHATDHYPPHFSGHALAVAQLTHQLARRGHAVAVVADAVVADAVVADAVVADAVVADHGAAPATEAPVLLPVPRWPLLPPSHLLAATRPFDSDFRQQLERFAPAIVHLHGYGPLCQRIARHYAGLPWVATVHGLPQQVLARSLPGSYALLWRRLITFYGRCRRVVAPSAYVARLLGEHGLGPASVRVIPSGVDLTLFRPAAGAERARLRRQRGWDRPTVAYLGRLSPEKGLDTFGELARRHPDIRWLALGSGPVTLPAAVERLPRLPQREVAELLRAVDLVFLPSVSETQGLVVAEALASGIPVVVPADTAAAEPVREGVNGALYPAAEVAAARDAIDRALHLDRSGIADTVRHLGWDRVVGQLEGLYAELLG